MKVYLQKNVLDEASQKRLEESCPYLQITNHPESDIEAAFVWPNFAVEERLALHPQLRWIQILSAGYDKVDMQAVNKRNLLITNARHVNSIPIAEDVVARILYFNRDMKTYTMDQQSKAWKPQQNAFELYHKTIGILGTGSIAVEISKRLKPFETTVIGFRQHEGPNRHFDELYYGQDGLKTMLSKSDYVIICLPLNDGTYHLLDREMLSFMKPNALLVNIARGDIVDESALIDALQSHQIRGASLDVFHQEPLDTSSPLWSLENVYVTPHISFSSTHFLERLTDLLIQNTERYFAEEPLMNRIK